MQVLQVDGDAVTLFPQQPLYHVEDEKVQDEGDQAQVPSFILNFSAVLPAKIHILCNIRKI